MFCSKCGVDDLRNFDRTIFRQDGLEIFAYHLGKCVNCGADIIEKEIFDSDGCSDNISMEVFLEENPDFSFEEKKEEKPSKLIIHETDDDGCGVIHYKGKTEPYSYDDCIYGDIKSTVKSLIDLGFIKPEQVLIFEQNQLYEKFGQLIERG